MHQDINSTPHPSHGLLGTILTFLMLLIDKVSFFLPSLSAACLCVGILSGLITIMVTIPKVFDAYDKVKKRFIK